MGGSPQNTSGAAPTGNPIFDNLFGQIKDKQAEQTGTQKFGQAIAQMGNNMSARAAGIDPSQQQAYQNLGTAIGQQFAPHNNVARPVGPPNLFDGFHPQMPSFGGGETTGGGGIGAQPMPWGGMPPRRIGMPVRPAPGVPLPQVNLSAPVANATPTLFS